MHRAVCLWQLSFSYSPAQSLLRQLFNVALNISQTAFVSYLGETRLGTWSDPSVLSLGAESWIVSWGTFAGGPLLGPLDRNALLCVNFTMPNSAWLRYTHTRHASVSLYYIKVLNCLLCVYLFYFIDQITQYVSWWISFTWWWWWWLLLFF